jgi:hypothetical protein
MDLSHPYRLVFEPLAELKRIGDAPEAPLEPGVRILNIEDYHGKSRRK